MIPSQSQAGIFQNLDEKHGLNQSHVGSDELARRNAIHERAAHGFVYEQQCCIAPRRLNLPLRRNTMKRILTMVAGLAFTLVSAQWAAAQDLASQIVGVWKMTSYARKDVETGKTSATFGERPVGYCHYTRGGHFVSDYVAQDRKINAKAELTDAESLEAFKTM